MGGGVCLVGLGWVGILIFGGGFDKRGRGRLVMGDRREDGRMAKGAEMMMMMGGGGGGTDRCRCWVNS